MPCIVENDLEKSASILTKHKPAGSTVWDYCRPLGILEANFQTLCFTQEDLPAPIMQHKWFGAIDLSFAHYSPSSPRFQYRLDRYNEIKQALLNAMLFLGEIKVWRSAGFSFFTANSRYRTVGFTLVTDPVSPLSMRWVQDLSNRLCPMVLPNRHCPLLLLPAILRDFLTLNMLAGQLRWAAQS